MECHHSHPTPSTAGQQLPLEHRVQQDLEDRSERDPESSSRRALGRGMHFAAEGGQKPPKHSWQHPNPTASPSLPPQGLHLSVGRTSRSMAKPRGPGAGVSQGSTTGDSQGDVAAVSRGSGTRPAPSSLPGTSGPADVLVCGHQELDMVPHCKVLLQQVGAAAPGGHALSCRQLT